MAVKKNVEAVTVPAAAVADEIAHPVAVPAADVPALAASVVVEPVAAMGGAAPTLATATAQAEITQKMEKAMKTTEEFVSFGQGNVEAFVKAGQIWAAGVQDLSKQFAATAQAQMDQTVATFKALAGVKSIKEAIDLQTNLTRSSVEKAVAETGKLTDASLKLTEQTFAPITARVTLAMEKFGRTA